MASATLSSGHPFPASTTTYAYDDVGQVPGNYQPPGTPDASAAVTSEGVLTFTGLTLGTYYWVVGQVSGAWRWVRIHPASDDVDLEAADSLRVPDRIYFGLDTDTFLYYLQSEVIKAHAQFDAVGNIHAAIDVVAESVGIGKIQATGKAGVLFGGDISIQREDAGGNLSCSAVTFQVAGQVWAQPGSAAKQVVMGDIGGGVGGLLLGSATDVNLYREAAGILATTTKLHVGGELELDGALNHDGSTVGFYGTAPAAKPTVTGSRGANAALASLLTGLAGLGLVTDSSS